MSLSVVSAAEYTLPELYGVMNRAFEGYIIGSITFDTPGFAHFLAGGNVHLGLSQVVLQDDTPVGLGLIARQGWSSRLAAMGVVPDAKYKGVGKWFMGELLQQARNRGDKTFVLEVFEQNEPGVKVYRHAGMHVVRRLMGYRLENPDGEASPQLQQVDCVDVAKVVMQHSIANPPWQVSAPHISRIAPPSRAYKLGEAYAVISNPDADTVAILSLIVPREHRNRGHAKRLLRALFAAFPKRTWRVPQICPEEVGERIFLRMGFTPDSLNQFQMEIAL